MKQEEVNLILQILNLSLKYGVPVISNYFNNLNKETITQTDIDNLIIENKWEDYFK